MIYKYLINRSMGNSWRIISYNKKKNTFQIQIGSSRLYDIPLDDVISRIKCLNIKLYKQIKKRYSEYLL